MQILLDSTKNFYKANLHCHSTNSDGKLTTAELKEEFKKRGYQIVAFSDHEHLIDNSHLDDEDFLTITSCEVAIKEFPHQSTMKNFNMKVCHLNFYAEGQHNTLTPCYNSVYDHFKNDQIEHLISFSGEYEREYSAKGINDMIRTATDAGFLVAYNHPNWSLENAVQYLQYEGLFAVEIYNHASVVGGGTDYCINVFDDLLRAGKKIFCTMADDCHARFGTDTPNSDMFGGFVMINSDELSYQKIISALKRGEFYASNGPLIYRLERDGDWVFIKTSKAARIALSTAGRRCEAVNSLDNIGITEAKFKLQSDDGYFRITVTDFCGKHAHTQGYEV